MNFIEEEDFLFLQRSEDGGEFAFAFKERPGAGLDDHAKLIGDDLRESGFPEAGRPIEQHVVEGLAAAARGFDRNGDVFLDPFLADVFGERFGAHAGVKARVVVKRSTADDALGSMSIMACHCFFLTEFRHIFCRLAFCRISSPTQLHLRAGVLSDARVTRSSFSKLEVPASRLASARAVSAVRSSQPRLSSADFTSASRTAAEEVRAYAASLLQAATLA